MGRWRRAGITTFPPHPVTQADKERVLAQVREQGKQFGMPQDLPIEYPFADTKPPFDFALGRPEGEVWLQRPRDEEAAPVHLRRLRLAGKWHREVTFPATRRSPDSGGGGGLCDDKAPDGTKTVGRLRLK